MTTNRKLLAGMISAGLIWNTSALALDIPPEILNEIQQHGTARVIVGLDVPWQPEGLLRTAEAVVAQRQQVTDTQQQFVTTFNQDLVDSGIIDYANSNGEPTIPADREFETIPYLVMEVNSQTLPILQQNALATGFELDAIDEPTLAQSLPLIGADKAWSYGYTGKGQTVAILDTGVEKSHPFFASNRIVQEACFSTTFCPNGQVQQIGAGAAAPCTYDPASCAHGTHVAGIAASVAKEANLIAVQVFSKNSTKPGSFKSDQLSALDWLQKTYGNPDSKLAAVNMSLGGGKFASACNDDSRKKAIDNLRSVGIATIVSSGNDGYSDGIGAPACISSAISVGATDKSDNVASFSNSASILNLLAPGVDIVSSVPGGKTLALSGTSMAAPHVAGAWAVLKAAKPTATVDEVLTTLQSTGKGVTGKGVTKPRVVVDATAMTKPKNPTNGHTYQLINKGMTWAQGKNYCESQGGYLATITSQSEQDFVFNNVCAGNTFCWLGGTNDGNPGKWRWITGETWEYTKWNPGEPSNDYGGETVLHLYGADPRPAQHWRGVVSFWNDYRPTASSFPICEWGAVKVTLTVTKSGDGTITAQGINCGTDCTEDFAPNTQVTLTATSTTGSMFKQWTGDCTGTNATVTVTMDKAKSCTATFESPHTTLAYVANPQSNTVSVIDTSTNSVVATIPVGTFPIFVAANPSGTRVYVANMNDSIVSVIDTRTNSVVATVTVEDGAFGITATGTRVYVSNVSDNKISAIDTSTNSVVTTTVELNGYGYANIMPLDIAVNPTETRLYTANFITGDVSVVDIANKTEVATIALRNNQMYSQGPCGVAINPTGTRLYVATCWGDVSVIDTSTNGVVATIPVGGENYDVVVNPTGTRIYATSETGIKVIDASTNNVVTTIAVGIGSSLLAMDPTGTRVYVTNSEKVSIIDTSKNSVVATVPVENGPAGVAVVDTAVTTRNLTVTKTGDGTVTSTPAGIDCGTDCTENFAPNTLVTLTATAGAGTTFTWGGDCTGNNATVTVTMDKAKSCTATFTLAKVTLTVVKTGNGKVTGQGIDCGTDCTEDLAPNTQVTLTATATTGAMFKQWTGDCTGTNATVTVTMDKAKSCSATFELLPTYTLNVTKTGNGNVKGTGIDCGTDCTEANLAANTQVTLTATPDAGNQFAGWAGACTGTEATTTVTMTTDQTCEAKFMPAGIPLIVKKSDDGKGRISGRLRGETTSLPCDNTCQTASYNYPKDGVVILSATADKGFEFKTWTCTGSSYTQDPATPNILKVTMTTATTCTANFDAIPGQLATLTVNLIGTGSGTIVSNKTGFTCQGSQCTGTYAIGQKLTLTATPSPFATFVNWGSDCTGTNLKVSVTLTKDMTCTAQYQSNFQVAAQQMVQAFYDQAITAAGDVASLYPPADNTARLQEAFEFATLAILQADSHLATTGQWPTQLSGLPWYQKQPLGQYTDSLQLQPGEYLDLRLKLKNNAGVEQEVAIIIYYQDQPPVLADDGSGWYSIPIYVPKSFTSQWGW